MSINSITSMNSCSPPLAEPSPPKEVVTLPLISPALMKAYKVVSSTFPEDPIKLKALSTRPLCPSTQSPLLKGMKEKDGTLKIPIPMLYEFPTAFSEEYLPTEYKTISYPRDLTYLGDVKGKKRWGLGRMINTQQEAFFKNCLMSEGIYAHDVLNGFGRSYFSNEKYYEGMFHEGRYHGYGAIKDRKTDKVLSQNYYERGLKLSGKENIDDQKFYIGFYDKNGHRTSGYLIEKESYKILYQGSFKDNEENIRKSSSPPSPSKSSSISTSFRGLTSMTKRESLSSSSPSPSPYSRKSPSSVSSKTKSYSSLTSRSSSSSKELQSSKIPMKTPVKLAPLVTQANNWIENDHIIYLDGSEYRGSTLNKKKDGYGMMVGPDKVMRYKGFYKDDLKEGFGQSVDVNGSLYCGLYSKGLRHGIGEYLKGDKTLLGVFLNDDIMTGCECFSKESTVYFGHFQNFNRADGVFIDMTNGEILYHGKFISGQPHGSPITWIKSGEIWRGNCFAGKFQGMVTIILEDGHEWKGMMIDDEPNGLGIKTDKCGNLVSKIYFCHGMSIDGIVRYSEDRYYHGDLDEEIPHGKGVIKNKEGTHTYYEGDFVDGLKHGDGTDYAEDGSVEYSGEFYEGQRLQKEDT